MDAAQIRKDDARRETLRFLSERHHLALDIPAIRRGVNRSGFDLTDTEILMALDLLVDAGHVTALRETHGAIPYFKATRDGVIAHERGGLS